MDDLDALLDQPSGQNQPQATRTDTQNSERVRRVPESAEAGHGNLGIDEQIKVRKPRAPIARLDEQRLLSEKGIPQLRRVTKKIKFKGKGHEFSDVARILTTYQLWLDSMFPKANFADGLELIEKLGHKKRLQVMRREWIKEDYPKSSLDDDAGGISEDMQVDQDAAHRSSSDARMAEDEDSLFVSEDITPLVDTNDALNTSNAIQGPSTYQPQGKTAIQGLNPSEPGDDELDDLLAGQTNVAPQPNRFAQEDEFADDMEAMGDDW